MQNQKSNLFLQYHLLAPVGDGTDRRLNRSISERHPSRQQRIGRSGFTLLELMLVLAIIATVASLTVPRFSAIFERQRLSGAAQSIKIAWDEAILTAMRTGQTQVFQCQLDTGIYTIQPLIVGSDAVDAGAGASLIAGSGMLVETENVGGATIATAASTPKEKSLGDNIVFFSCFASADNRAFSMAQESTMSGTGALNTQNIAQTVLFYPNGSGSTAEVQLRSERGDIRAVRMRGLTGHTQVVEIANVSSADEEQ